MAHLRFCLILLLGLLAPPAAAQVNFVVNAQTGTSYTLLNSDCGKFITFSNASAIAVTLPQAGSNGNFVSDKCTFYMANLGAGNATITPITSTIGGRTSFILQQGGGLAVTSKAGNWSPTNGFTPALGTTGFIDGDQLPPPTGGKKGGVQAGTCTNLTGAGSDVLNVSDSCRTGGPAVPICPAGVGCGTAGAPDIYPMPFSGVIVASTVPIVLCRVSPAATVTFLVKKWTAGNPASSSTLCTGSISTACAVSSCSISSTSIAAGDGLSVEGTEASADAAAVISVTVPVLHQ